MRLAGIEVAEVSASTASATAASSAKTASATPAAKASAESATTAVPAKQAALASVAALAIQAALRLDRLRSRRAPGRGSRPAIALTCPACPVIATDSSLKSELPAIDGNAAPLAPAVPAPVSVSAAQRSSSGSDFRAISLPFGEPRRNIALLVGLLLIQCRLPRSKNQFEVH